MLVAGCAAFLLATVSTVMEAGKGAMPSPVPGHPPAVAAVAATTPEIPPASEPASAPETGSATVADAEPHAGLAKKAYLAGEDPAFAAKHGWPVAYPAPLDGAILPGKRIVAYYGNPRSTRMGVLGEYPKDEMLERLRREVENWREADPEHEVQPALHLVAVVAQGTPGASKKYRLPMPDELIREVHGWAREAGALLFIDIQTGHDDIRTLLPRFAWILENPDVHLGIDPEFNLVGSDKVPGTKIGSFDAEDINYASAYLRDIVRERGLPPKVLVVHRFTRRMVTGADKIELRPEVAVVMNMDGWGAPFLKRDTYRDYIVREPVQFTGFKLFYHNDTKGGHPLLTPSQILRLIPTPLYIQYQ
ncbi:MAG: hypothetical protein LBT74_06120 [Acidobacteriota bacterium]|nr:hypothetical protein [Acidobacteriota bacterium]